MKSAATRCPYCGESNSLHDYASPTTCVLRSKPTSEGGGYVQTRVNEHPAAHKHGTLSDRNPESVVGVPWNEDGYAGDEHPAAKRDLVIVREVVTRSVLEERDGEFVQVASRVMHENEWVQDRKTAMEIVGSGGTWA